MVFWAGREVIFAIALLLITAIGLGMWFFVHEAAVWLEAHHTRTGARSDEPFIRLLCVMAFPLSAMISLVTVAPILVYMIDHTPFQSLVLLRPDHYFKLFFRVYSAWFDPANNGKLSEKEL